MKRLISILIIALICSSLYAQRTDKKSDSLKLPSIKSDTLAKKLGTIYNRIDSLNPQKKLDNSRVSHIADSLNATKLLELKFTSIKNKSDSINPVEWLASYNHKIDSLHSKLTARIDSLQRLKVPDIKMVKSLDSIRGKLDSLKTKGIVKDFDKAEKKFATLESGASSKVNGIGNKINSKLSLFNKNGGNAGNVDGVNLRAKLPGVNTNLPTLNTKINTPSLNLPGGSVGGTGLPGAPTLPGSSGLNVGSPELPKTDVGIDNLGNIQKQTSEISRASGQIGQYQKDLQGLKKGEIGDTQQLSKDLEGKVAGMTEVSGLQKETLSIEKQKALLEKWNSDPEYRKEMAVNQAKEQSVNYFAGHQQELNAAMGQLSKAKSKVRDVEEVADIFGKHTNPMKGKAFIERLRPGINIQFQIKQDLLLDFNPQIGYRLNGRLTIGAGWNERIGFNTNTNSFMPDARIYGPRSYVQFKIKEGYHAIVIAEVMNTYISAGAYEPVSGRQWINGVMAGFKKEFRFSSRMLGNVQILYNFYDPHHASPYADRLNIRMGFEFPQKKKTKTAVSVQ